MKDSTTSAGRGEGELEEIAKPEAGSLKDLLIRFFLKERNAVGAAHEFTTANGICDVFAIEHDLTTIECEIKCSHADLKMELDIISAIKKGINPQLGHKNVPFTKAWKHRQYLAAQYRNPNLFIPHKFYFVVPEYLMYEAEEGVKGTPYGVIVFWGSTLQFTTQKRASRLHKEPITLPVIAKLCRRLSVVSYLFPSHL